MTPHNQPPLCKQGAHPKQGARISTTLNNTICVIAAMASMAVMVLLIGSGRMVLGFLFLIPFFVANLRMRIHEHKERDRQDGGNGNDTNN